jgi:hypothetical protein
LEDTLKTGAPSFRRRFILLAAVGILAVVLTACTGRGGGQLPPSAGFTGPASFGFSFSCENGKLGIELSYSDKGSSVFLGAPFSIHGTVDQVDPVLESATCIDHNPPPAPENQLIFLGRYRLTSSPRPTGFPPTSTCPTQETSTSPLCRFEVIVQDNDRNRAPSMGDTFSIKLSTVTAVFTNDCPPEGIPPCVITEFPAATVFYARAGTLSSGNLTVD